MSTGTILAVDDEPDILIALEDLFENEYRILTTSRPAEAGFARRAELRRLARVEPHEAARLVLEGDCVHGIVE